MDRGEQGLQFQPIWRQKGYPSPICRPQQNSYVGHTPLLRRNSFYHRYRRSGVLRSHALMRLGLPPHLARFQLHWLENTKYSLKLGHSLSQSYCSSPTQYLYGTGQGTGWSPPSWAAISDIISRVMDKHTAGIKLVHPNGMSDHRRLDVFVDDVNTGLTTEALLEFIASSLISKHPSLYHQTKTNIQFYSNNLFSTGGRLALHKCYIYLLIMTWIYGKRKYSESQKTHSPIQIKQGLNQEETQIQLISPKESRRMLGVYTAPDGSSKKQADVLINKSRKWQQAIRDHPLHPHETLMSYRQGIMKSLEYPLGPSLLSKPQCHQIQSPALTECLKRNGIVSTI